MKYAKTKIIIYQTLKNIQSLHVERLNFSYEMLRISKGKETFTLKGDHLETNFQGFYQKSLHWRPNGDLSSHPC